MKKFFTTLISFSFVPCFMAMGNTTFRKVDADNVSLTKKCKSAYLCDYASGECVYSENESERVPVASVCKVMTLNLCFEAISEGKISMDDTICVSDNAAGMGGSQVFLQSGLSYPVHDLLKSIIVCSANDSCVAMSEALCGNEDKFVALMNKRVYEYGCTDTLFANCTGLPKDMQYSCAKDVAVMFSHLIEYDEYFSFSKIWVDDFNHPDGRTTMIANTNKLLRRYKLCDGGKTGFTNQAGFCLVSSAKKENLRLISVVLGADNSDDRFSSAISLFDYGFANYKNAVVLDENVNMSDCAYVKGGKKKSISVRPSRNSYVFSSKESAPDIKFNVVTNTLKAPVAKGDYAGYVEVYKGGVLCDTVDLVAAEDAAKAKYSDSIKNVAEEWAL